jgi:hypothetical protein
VLGHTILGQFAAAHAYLHPHTYWYLRNVSAISPEENSYNFLLWPKMMTATSTEHSTDNSWAFLKRPPLRFRKVLQDWSVTTWRRGEWQEQNTYTERLRSSLIARISIFLRPMMASACACDEPRGCTSTLLHKDFLPMSREELIVE